MLRSSMLRRTSGLRGFCSTASRFNEQEVQKIDLQKLKHMQYLLQFYEPKIVESIMLAESTIEPEHWEKKQLDPTRFAPHYIDDFTTLDPYFDHLPKKADSYLKIAQPNKPDIPEGVNVAGADSESYNVLDIIAKDLSKATGLSTKAISTLRRKTLVSKMVANQTSKGKIRTFYSLVCSGNGRGMVGIGEGRDPESPQKAEQKALWQAVKNLVQVPRLEQRTIYGNVENKYGATIVHLRSAPSGSGLRCNHIIFELAQCAGLKDLSASVYRSRNPMNVAKCAVEALLKQKTPEQIALERGKKVVDLRKEYYSTSD